MIRAEPDSFDALMRDLLRERYATTDRDRWHGGAVTDSPDAFAHRRKVLNDAMADDDGNVIPLRRQRAG